jgi:mechanosensitive ion channel-like protein
LIAKLIAKAANAILERVGFDRAVERGGIKRALERTKYDASDILGKVIFYALFLIVLQMAFGVFGPNPISDLLEGVIAYLPKVIAAILILVIAFAIAAAARELIDATLGGLSYGRVLANIAGAAIVVVGVFAALDQLQIAPAIVTGLFYALLAIVVGSAVIAIGGGGIYPMRARWERALAKYDEEKPNVQRAAQGSKERIDQRAQQRMDQARAETAPGGDGATSAHRV